MKYIITIESSKEVSKPEYGYSSYRSTETVTPQKHEIYLAIQEYLGANNYQVSQLSVKEVDDDQL